MQDHDNIPDAPDEPIATDRKRLGLAIRSIREAQGLKQEDVAKWIGRSVPTVSKIESGQHPLDYQTLMRVSAALRVSAMRLIWSVERESAAARPGLERMVPVFDTLLDSLEAATTEGHAIRGAEDASR